MYMNRLNIQQSNGIETVGNSSNTVGVRTVEKLYQEAKDGLDHEQEVELEGSILVDKAYRDSVEWLQQNTGLNITVTDEYYIRFRDAEVGNICKTNWGDTIGVTEGGAQIPTSLNYIFKGNTNIEYFDELKYFTNIKKINHNLAPYNSGGGEFYECSNLKIINFSNIEEIQGTFIGCSELIEVKNFSGFGIARYQMYGSAFSGCSKLTTINLSNCEYIAGSTFEGCTALSNIGDLKKVKGLGGLSFKGCSSLRIDVNIPNIGNFQYEDPHNNYYRRVDMTDAHTYYNIGTFCSSGIISISDLGTVCTKIRNGYWGSNQWGFAQACPNLRFVILPAQLDEIGTLAFKNDTALEYVKVLATTPPTLNETDITSGDFPFYNTTCNFYVPDASVNDYKAAAGWSSMASRIFPMSQFSTDFPND